MIYVEQKPLKINVKEIFIRLNHEEMTASWIICALLLFGPSINAIFE